MRCGAAPAWVRPMHGRDAVIGRWQRTGVAVTSGGFASVTGARREPTGVDPAGAGERGGADHGCGEDQAVCGAVRGRVSDARCVFGSIRVGTARGAASRIERPSKGGRGQCDRSCRIRVSVCASSDRDRCSAGAVGHPGRGGGHARCGPVAPRRRLFGVLTMQAPADTEIWRPIPGTKTPDDGGSLLIGVTGDSCRVSRSH
jgi:hypothetical protein